MNKKTLHTNIAMNGPYDIKLCGSNTVHCHTDHSLQCWSKMFFTLDSILLSRILAIIWASVRLSIRPSVCPSVTLVICIKTVQARITKSSLWAAPRSLVYCDKTSCHWVQGFSSNEGIKEAYPLKKTPFCRYWLK